MAVFKCKMCGGALEIDNNETVVTCEYCGTKQTLPKLDDDRKANLYDRANHFRRNNEFDKAMGIYEQILNEDSTDAEAYWSLVLCRYGIEYVEDPSTRKRLPTINRAQFTSVFDDEDYKSALQYADGYQKDVYEQEAAAINEIQKGILAISSQEEPFDVFICYKESDKNGRRTPDSVLATELYHELTREGFKVFFSRITLEDKLGTAYEPYIFAALNSSKVMVVLGTKPEYFGAVWVKNEWSRYLSLIKNGARKILIPAYKDMDPYDLPDEFSHLQAQDMSKLGFMQDLVRGVKKIVQATATEATVVKETVISSGNANTAPLLKRVFIFLEDEDWDSAEEYCEKVLDIDPECAEAYLGKLMAELRVKVRDELKNSAEPFDNNANYKKVLRFGDSRLKNELAGYIEFINTRNQNARLEEIYNKAKNAMAQNTTEIGYKGAAQLFESIADYKDASILAKECYEKAEIARKDGILNKAKNEMNGEIASYYECAIKLLESISGWKNADELIIECKNKIEELKAKAEAARLERERQAEIARIEAEKRAKRNKKIAIISTIVACIALAFVVVLNSVIIPNSKYNDAVALMNDQKYIEAYDAFVAMNGYKDSDKKAQEIFNKCILEKFKLLNVGDYIEFGSYEQDNDTSNGKEAIEWLVLDKRDDKALVISKYALECQPYNTNDINVTWETCSLRTWLNNDFINTAFSDNERSVIPTVMVSADENPDYNTDPGNATQDRVFLLSVKELMKYFDSNDTRLCKATKYVVKGDLYVSDLGRHCWWSRTPGGDSACVAGVRSQGSVSEYGSIATSSYGVRPAMWIDIGE